MSNTGDAYVPISNITDLEDIRNIYEVLHKCITLRPDYWGRYARSFIEIHIDLINDRVSLFKELLRYINKATVPPVDLLDKIPRNKQENYLYNNLLASAIRSKTIDVTRERVLYIVYSILGNYNIITTYSLSRDNDFSLDAKRFNNKCVEELKTDLNLDPAVDIETVYKAWAEPYMYTCFNCNIKNAYAKCITCGISYYCSKQCQMTHWKLHKTQCMNLRFNKLCLSYLVAISK